MLRFEADLFFTTNKVPHHKSPLETTLECRSLSWVINIIIKPDWEVSYDWDKTDYTHDKSILPYAAEIGDSGLIEALTKVKAGIYVQDKYMETPLHHAAEKNHLEAVKVLSNAGASPMIIDFDQRMPRGCAAQKKHERIIDYLLLKEFGYNIDLD